MNTEKAVLIVEDDMGILSALKMILEEKYQVKTAINGKQAMDIIQSEGVPQLILLDMRMPIMDGWKFAEEFHKHYGHKSPIVVMTAASDAAKRASDIKAEGWMGKPFDLENLESTLNRYMAN